MSYRKYYDNIAIKDIKICEGKWRPILEKIEFGCVITEMCIFCEKYSQLIEMLRVNNIQSPYHLQFSHSSQSYQPYQLPSDFYDLRDALDYIREELEDFIDNKTNIQSKIVEEYYNVLTGKKGILLENDVRIEDGKIKNKNYLKKVNNLLTSNVNHSINFILDPSIRKNHIREKKLERVMNNNFGLILKDI